MRKDGGPISAVFSGVIPLVLVYILAILIMMVFPAIALWLPQVMK